MTPIYKIISAIEVLADGQFMHMRIDLNERLDKMVSCILGAVQDYIIVIMCGKKQ